MTMRLPSFIALSALLASVMAPGAVAADVVEVKVLCVIAEPVLEALATVPPACLLGLAIVGCVIVVTLIASDRDTCERPTGICRITVEKAESGRWYPCPLGRQCVTGEEVVVWAETKDTYTDTTVSGRAQCGAPPPGTCGPRFPSCSAVSPRARLPATPVCEGKLDTISTADRTLDVVCSFAV